MKALARFSRERSGATAIEYGLIAALVSIAMIAGFSQAATSIQNTFTTASNTLDDHAPPQSVD